MFIEFIDKYKYHFVVGMTVFAMIFIMIGHIYKEQIQSVLKQPLYTVKSFDIDLWSVTHFMLFTSFGFIFPNNAFTFIFIGTLFEIFEDGMASDGTTQLINCKDTDVKQSFTGSVFCKGYGDSYWYSKLDDIAMNAFGYITGQGVRNTFF